MKHSISEIADILKAEKPKFADLTVDTLLTDSRSLTYPESSLFFALSTSNNDGHKYIKSLYEKGVRNFVVSHVSPDYPKDANYIVVDDVLTALQTLGASHRNMYSFPVVGITGSKGKTTL